MLIWPSHHFDGDSNLHEAIFISWPTMGASASTAEPLRRVKDEGGRAMEAAMRIRVRTLGVRIAWRVAVFAIVLGASAISIVKPSLASASTTKLPSEFITKVNAYCSAEEARFNQTLGKFPFNNFNPNHPDLSTMRKVGAHFAKALPIRRAIPTSLMNLGEPEVGKAQWDELRTLALQSDRLAISQVHIALTGTTKAFVANINQTTPLQNKLESIAVRDGCSKSTPCSNVF